MYMYILHVLVFHYVTLISTYMVFFNMLPIYSLY